ncbi:MAG TPA: UDP-N-acetylmuramate--L-alanine ligase [Thermoanaerobaculales bacterium]|nr:UDP-N-acetylmuramate--L-alanine ligase [Thermoanaerobaculales bacterium]HQL30053.1 UDP-N-acetylmuramate--L-alanine ligase [Thermoanaerobaculales bacterium]
MSRHLHFMGAGGVGMCGLAEVLLSDGLRVSGCDLELTERTARLVELGATMARGHDPAHLGGVDALVVSAAVNPAHPEVAAARTAGVPVVRRAELLGWLMRKARGVAVAGTHGKTTTTALAGHLLDAAGLAPTVVVGGNARFMGAHGRRGTGELIVCEADEYDRSFLELDPEIAVITNVEAEHLDCYDGPDDLHAAFATFANRAAPFGVVVLCGDDPGARSLAPRLRRRALWYGIAPGLDLVATGIAADAGGSRFVVESAAGGRLGSVKLPLLGRHNVRNALAALAVGLELGVDFDRLAAACESFAGVARRFQVLGERAGVTVVDDYAHHPTEISAVLAAARQAMPGRRLVAVFQPHLFSRTRDFAGAFGEALLAADVTIVLPIYPARETPIPGIDGSLVADEARRRGHAAVETVDGMAGALARLGGLLQPGDVLLTLGAGDVHRLAESWLGGGR